MRNTFATLKTHMEQTIVGQSLLVERLLTAVLADGHLLVEGLPGLAKTTAVHTLADGMALRFQRIQFTPDLIPGDITGTDIFVPGEGRFRFVEGPLFSDIILADEINRAPPKVQSALLEAMQERQVTAGGATRPLSKVFMVMATQNPIEQEGTYPLPDAQLDRFLMKVDLDYPKAEEELEILRRDTVRLRGERPAATQAVLTAQQVLEARSAANRVYMDQMLERYIVALVGATRDPSPWDAEATAWLSHGASPRATLALARAAHARAWLRDRDFVEPGDIMDLAYHVLNHRIALSFAARAEGVTRRQVIARLVEKSARTVTEPLLSTTELEQLQWRVLERRRLPRHAVAAALAGQQTSVFRGRGMELEEVRAYQPGDDVRRMDWRATARTGRPVVKVFREERSRGLFLLVDRGPAMRFGTRGELKAARAARVAAILAFSALAGRDSVAGIVAGGGEEFFPPARNLEGTLALLRAACAPLPEEHKPLPIERLIEQSGRAAERGASICLISDFARLHEHHVPPLIRLATHHNVLAVRIIDPGEEELPNTGKLRIVSPVTGRITVIDTSDATLRARYAKAMAERSTALKNLFRRAGIALHQIHTHRDVLQEMENLDIPT